MTVTIRVKGLAELERKLDGSVLLQPEAEAAVETIGARIARPTGKRIGVKRNTISRAQSGRLQETISTTLAGPDPHRRRGTGPRRRGTPRPGWQQRATWYNPRRKGTAWVRYQEKLLKGTFGRNVMKKMAERIAARFAK